MAELHRRQGPAPRDRIRLTELKLAAFEDPERARDVADDCAKLFVDAGSDGDGRQDASTDFGEIRTQGWYERLWSSLTSGSPRHHADTASTLREAQELLLAVLRTHAETNAKSNALVALLARRLREQRTEPTEIAEQIIKIASKVLLFERGQARAAASTDDPGHPTAWDQAERLLLYKALVIASAADGYLAAEEEVLLEHKLRELGLDDERAKAASAFEAAPHPIDDELRRIASYPMRLNIFRHAMGMVHCDGDYDPQERAYIERLAVVLRLEPEDAEKMKRAFARFRGEVSHGKIVEMIAAREQDRNVSQVHADLLRTGPIWASFVAGLLSEAAVAPVLQRYERYGALERATFEEIVTALGADDMVDAMRSTLGRVEGMARSFITDVQEGLLLPQSVTERSMERLGSAWAEVTSNDGGLGACFEAVVAAGRELAAAYPSATPTRVELSFAGAARQGPLGWAASVAADSFVSVAEREAFETAAAAWDSAVNKLADATHAWQDRVEQLLRRLFLDVVDAIVEAAATADAKAASFPLLRMYEHMEEVDDQAPPSRALPTGHKPCPRCGRSYPPKAKWCAICSVDL